MMIKTNKGTELQLLNLKGKQYLPVAQRLVWFREEKPTWGIETSFLSLEADFAIARALISDESGRTIATGTKREDAKHFPDFMEKAETGSIGRALALCGYGTQFAEELEEGERVVDAPQTPKKAPVANLRPVPPAQGKQEPGAYVFTFGKYARHRVDSIDMYELDNYIKFLKRDENPSTRALEAIAASESFLATRDRSIAGEVILYED